VIIRNSQLLFGSPEFPLSNGNVCAQIERLIEIVVLGTLRVWRSDIWVILKNNRLSKSFAYGKMGFGMIQ
jgi:hypothetical protein